MNPLARNKPHLVLRRARSLLARLRAARGHETARSVDAWNSEYESGKWGYLAALPELSRYSVLLGYAMHFNPAGSILDVGCGDGVLYRRARAYGVARYVGIDLSDSAIARARESADGNSAFIAADAHNFEPTEQFDTIVFNEVLYYFPDPAATVKRYVRALKSGGVILLSTCAQFDGAAAILAGLKRRYALLDETRVTHNGVERSWIVTALAAAGVVPAAGPAA